MRFAWIIVVLGFALPGFAEGQVTVQDEAAQLVIEVMGPVCSR